MSYQEYFASYNEHLFPYVELLNIFYKYT